MATLKGLRQQADKKTVRTGKRNTRSKPRVDQNEKSSTVAKSAQHRQVTPGKVELFGDGVVITSQMSELVPVAQYVNVTLGPIQIQWRATNIDMETIADIDWDQDYDAWSKEEQAAYDQAAAALKAGTKLLEARIAEDRELVEESVRLYNEREAEKKKS